MTEREKLLQWAWSYCWLCGAQLKPGEGTLCEGIHRRPPMSTSKPEPARHGMSEDTSGENPGL